MVGPAKRAYSYDLLIYGSEAGYLSSRAQIELHGPSTQDTIAWVRFCDPAVAFPLDTYNNGIVDAFADFHVRTGVEHFPHREIR